MADAVLPPVPTGSPTAQAAANDQPPAPTAEKKEVSEPTPEELEWQKLSGSAQDRFRELIAERNQALNEREALLQTQSRPLPPPPPAYEQTPQVTADSGLGRKLTPQEIAALESLRSYGVLTVDDAKALMAQNQMQEQKMKEYFQDMQDQLLIENEYRRLEGIYNGKDGKPSFDRTLVEDHMKRNAIYNPEKAYSDMYRDELYDWKYKSQQSGGKSFYSEKPVGSTGASTEPVTIEGVRARLQQPDGKQWWEDNRAKILPILGQLQGSNS